MRTYTFHVSLPGTGRTWRKIEMAAEQTLEDLHYAIQNAFEFDADHLYSFFMSGKAWDRHSEYRLPEGATPWSAIPDEEEEAGDQAPEPPEREETAEEREASLRQLFGGGPSLEEMEAFMKEFWQDVKAEAEEERKRDVRIVTLESLDLEEGQTFMYLFDYGDEWRFKVRVHAINPDAPADADYPRIVESVGDAPQQYPDWEEW